MWGTTATFAALCSLLNHTAIAIDRYFAITRAIEYRDVIQLSEVLMGLLFRVKNIQDDPSGSSQPPVDIKTKVAF